MKKNIMAVLTASSVAVMAVGATLAAYAEPEQEQQIKDEAGTYAYGVDSKCLYINTPDGFANWKADTRIKSNGIKAISFDNFYDENGGEIPAGAFEGLTSVESVVFQNTITKIGDNAFKGCTSLVDIVFEHSPEVIDDKLITIGKSAFEGCTSIAELDFRETLVEKIGESAFKGCTSISKLVLYSEHSEGNKRIEVKSPVAEIGKSAFQGCTGLMDITFDPDLREIGESAFEGCINLGITDEKPNEETNGTDTIIWLHSVTFGSKGSAKLETIGKRAFYGCEKLTAIGFPANVKTIGEYAFANCTSLYVADMWSCKQLTSIEKYAFFNCLSLMQVDFPDSHIYKNAYGYSSTAPKHTIAEGAFRNCSWLEGVILSPYVGDVAPGAFYKCKNLKYMGYYVDEAKGIGTDIEIKIDTEHSTQDSPVSSQISKSAVDRQSLSLLAESGEGSEKVTIYVPPEVTVFAFNKAEFEDKTAVRDETIIETFWEKVAEEHPGLTYDGQIFMSEPKWKYTYEGSEGPQEPTADGTRYI
ncbi:MAG: leucine-rich repeat domain-containing protein, partial [Oscillospiraceae bacterium]|nr:leucine-rich repeat domain-containing protein [Oscillospiraceae bacterium]